MITDIDDMSLAYEENGIEVIKQLDKVILTRGAWSTILFKYQEWNPENEEYGEEKYTLRRYRKVHDEYRQQSKFNISSKEQARQIVDVLGKWVAS